MASGKLKRVERESDRVALGAIISRVSDVTTFRTDRLEMAREHLSPSIRTLVLFMSLTLGVGFILMDIGTLIVHSYMVFSVVTAMYLLIVVLDDLNTPFSGMWTISDDPFRNVQRRLRQALGMTAAPSD